MGIIGLGRMGAAIALRLSDCGHQVIGWDIDPSVRASCASMSIRVADGAASVAEFSEVVLTALPDDHIVNQLFFAADGLLQGAINAKLFIEMSTLRPASGVALFELLGARDIEFVESPVLGTIPAARGGSLIALVGGSVEAVASARSLLSDLSSRVFEMGGPGSGYAMKLAVNLGLAAYIQGLSESLSLGSRYGLSTRLMLEVLSLAPTSNAWLEAKIGGLLGGPSKPSLDLVTLRKDVMSALAAGSDRGVVMPMTAGTLSAFSAATAAGWGRRDCADLIEFFQQHMHQFGPAESEGQAVKKAPGIPDIRKSSE